MMSLRGAIARLWDIDESAPMLQSDGQWLPWGYVKSLSERIDTELTIAGCAAGGRVAVVLANRTESVAALIAIIRGSRTLVTLSPLQPPHRLAADLEATAVDYVLAGEEDWCSTEFAAAVSKLGATGWSVDGDAVTMAAQGARRHAASAESAESGDDLGEVVIEMLTSGSTGPPKRIPLSRAQLEASLCAALQHNNRSDGSAQAPFAGSAAILTWPLVHISGMWGLLQALVSARRLVLFKRFNLADWHAAVKNHRPGLVGLPPAAIQVVLDSGIPPDDLASIRAINCGASPIEPTLVDAFRERFGIPILVVYGATEFSGAVAGWTLNDFRERWLEKKGSVGRAFPGVRLRVVDAAGELPPAGETGLLQVASPQSGAPSDEWITTSDLAHIDEDGFLYIDGRADGVIIRGGFKISPDTVVRSLRSHPAVSDAAVAGLPDDRLGQIPVGAVELRARTSVAAEELREFCRKTLTPYEVPARVYIVDELPRGASMKIDHRRLVAMLTDLTSGSDES
ncbi:fatty acid--CoA ligase family protein [Mycolicibacterium sp. 624]|uniref:class I adenylate-forming enzyme family protein n=1 Tax=Mycolicibacterium sp. 624 TaxID=3156314 RepID=UPI00339B2891